MSRSTRIPTSCKFTAPKERTAPLTGFPGRGAFFRIQVVFLLYKGGEGPLPSFRFAKCHCPFLSPGGDIFPRPGEVFPLRWSPWQKGQVSSSPVNGRKKPAVKLQTFRPCQSLSLSGEVARRSRDGEGCFRDEPSQSRCARQPVPLFVAWRRHLPPAGGSLSTQVEALARA